MPTTDVSGDANHPIGEDTSGNMSGNREVADPNLAPDPDAEDYDLDGTADADYDGNETVDWLMRVQLVEQRRSRVCNVPYPSDTPTDTPTITDTPTPTPTPTPTATPTPVPPDCSDIYFVGVARELQDDRLRIESVANNQRLRSTTDHTRPIHWDEALGRRVYVSSQSRCNWLDGFNRTGGNYYGAQRLQLADRTGRRISISRRICDLAHSRCAGTAVDGHQPARQPCPLVGDVSITFHFEYAATGLTCSETRTYWAATPTPTPTPTSTPTPIPAGLQRHLGSSHQPGRVGNAR